MSYANYVMPEARRAPRWSLTMAWWALFSAMFWIYVAVASANAVGTVNTIIGMVLTIASYGAINLVLSRYAARTGLTVELLSRTLFGIVGSALASLIFAATAIYYAVFEGSIIAVAFQKFFGGEITMWYAIVVIYALPLVAGGVQNWLDRLNGWLLPLYFAGLVAVVVAATAIRGVPVSFPVGVADGPVPGWLTSYLIYMGVWIMMMYTFDYARMARKKDEKFHGRITFGWVFYAFTFGVNGLVGIYIMSAWGLAGTETGVVDAFISSLGIFGVLVIFISQTRINTANYYLASSNLDAFATRVFRLALPRWVWVIVAGAIAYLLMLTNVLSYLLKALAWQGVFVTAWVAIALVYIALNRRNVHQVPEIRRERLSAFSAGTVAWLLASGTGIFLTEQTMVPVLAQLAPLITVALAAGGYFVAYRLQKPPAMDISEDVHVDEEQLV
ncbi:cytosine permease [Paenarthrobacter aurescens]|uniref:Allantoin permease n=1 Tax=Paenarthrobacter aurescens TaxID=43663 RepID=A0A4Y3NNE2_PAEAU|nr:permease [Paenarthrobacter aurescens]MDO6142699.1 permease [Paenarthrobacter aurescens]MDO6146546.1 permease [Paenarthrobacter aurescens]MDO6157791.1 permease [Paenarthrobacter aurescens]MDO6161776.1 permease [Paenarthrobacter aurescens]GEB20568.1 allantoin permease [Paenarthrobacter aurescens]